MVKRMFKPRSARRVSRVSRRRTASKTYRRKRMVRRRTARRVNMKYGNLRKLDFYFTVSAVAVENQLNELGAYFSGFLGGTQATMAAFDTTGYGSVGFSEDSLRALGGTRLVTSPYIAFNITGTAFTVRPPPSSIHEPMYLAYKYTDMASQGQFVQGNMMNTQVIDGLGRISKYFRATSVWGVGRRSTSAQVVRSIVPSDVIILAPQGSTVHVRLYVQEKLRTGEILGGRFNFSGAVKDTSNVIAPNEEAAISLHGR